MKKLDDLYGFIGEQADRVHTEYPYWPCKKGCSVLDGTNCCNASLFPVTKIEWNRVKGALHRLPQADRDEVRLAAREIYERYGLHECKGDFRAFYAEHGADEVPCPFLKNNLCRIFADRPVICRAFGYFTFEENPHWCREVSLVVHEHGVKRVPSWKALTERMAKLVRGPSKPICAWITEEERL